MNKHDIKVVLDNLYNEGKITLKEKVRIGGLSLEEALDLELIKEELGRGIAPSAIENETQSKSSSQRMELLNTKRFDKPYDEYNDNEVLMELLFAQQLQIEKLEEIRSNTSKLVWWLIAIPIILFILMFLIGGFDAPV